MVTLSLLELATHAVPHTCLIKAISACRKLAKFAARPLDRDFHRRFREAGLRQSSYCHIPAAFCSLMTSMLCSNVGANDLSASPLVVVVRRLSGEGGEWRIFDPQRRSRDC
jgi:hypothetical protein